MLVLSGHLSSPLRGASMSPASPMAGYVSPHKPEPSSFLDNNPGFYGDQLHPQLPQQQHTPAVWSPSLAIHPAQPQACIFIRDNTVQRLNLRPKNCLLVIWPIVYFYFGVSFKYVKRDFLTKPLKSKNKDTVFELSRRIYKASRGGGGTNIHILFMPHSCTCFFSLARYGHLT